MRWAVVEYEPGVLREEWCLEGHSGYVLDGEVTYEFENGDEPRGLRRGRGCCCLTATATGAAPATPGCGCS